MIYFIRRKDGGPVKIGTTIRLSQRLQSLCAEYGELKVLAVVDGSFPEERGLHHRFAHLHKVGEWFEPGDDLLAFIVSDGKPWNGKDEYPVEVVRIGAEISPALDDALEDCARKERRSKKATIELALEKYLSECGFWPPSDSAERRKPHA